MLFESNDVTPPQQNPPLPQPLFVLQACLAAGEGPLEGGFAGRERLKTWRGEESTKNQNPKRWTQVLFESNDVIPPAQNFVLSVFFSSLSLSSLELSDTQVYEPYIRALLGTASHFC